MAETELLDGGSMITRDAELNMRLGTVRNLSEPILLKDVNVCGVTAEAARGGETAKIWTRLALTSEEPIFYRIADGICNVIRHHAAQAGGHFSPERATSILLLIHPDNSAKLWVDSAAVAIQALSKRAMAAGSVVFQSDIGDISGLWFPAVEVTPSDRLVYLFREGWHFGLFFDLRGDGEFSITESTKTLGHLYRTLRYKALYEVLANEKIFSGIVSAGWFPFVEIVADEFAKLASHLEAGFDLSEAEAALLQAFDGARLDRMMQRWITKPHFLPKRKILEAAITAFKNGDPISSIKIAMSEIEGVLAAAHRRDGGTSFKMDDLISYVVNAATSKAGGTDTLLFPLEFAKYLQTYTYATFDPRSGDAASPSRHAVSHGAPNDDAFTQVRALQTLLTRDQVAFYT